MTEFNGDTRKDFNAARGRATLRKLVSLITRKKRELLSFNEVHDRLHLGGPVYRGIQTVPLSKIVGSVDRYKDFDRLFSPTQSHTEERWRRISRAWYKEISLPPVLLYKVGDAYFVVDGNHRVSVAKDRGQEFIDAEVREVKSKVPVTESITADELECLEAQVEFLERTQIDKALPGVQIETTLLGGYDRLIEHIAVHRYFMGIDQDRSISAPEAVAHWYETIYQPVTEVINQSEILEDFKGRTCADLYLWVMDHLHYLHGKPGSEHVEPVEAASDFVHKLSDDG
ncbi:MAG: hypothetical protein GTO18_13850 [Anaerolineales bacterium]|nr:hypothetical protein [Anaerolineales bacterium]